MPIFIYISCANKEEAKLIARTLVEKKLIACANLFPMESIYWWKNDIEESLEYVLIAKGMQEDFEALKMLVKDLHSYEIPCIVALPIADGNADYLEWIQTSTKKQNI